MEEDNRKEISLHVKLPAKLSQELNDFSKKTGIKKRKIVEDSLVKYLKKKNKSD